MAGHEVDVMVSVGTEIQGIKIQPAFADQLFGGVGDSQIAADMVSHNKLLLILMYILQSGATLEQAQAAVQNHVIDVS